MSSPTDLRLIALVELIAQKSKSPLLLCEHHTDKSLTAQIYETLAPLNGQVNGNTLSFIRRANMALEKWWQDNDELHRVHNPKINIVFD